MGTIILKWRVIALSASLALAFTLLACGSDEAPAAPAPTQPAPAPTQAAPATFVPATPVPPATFVAPTTESLADVSPVEAGLKGLGQLRSFPTELLQESERLPRDEVIALWTEFIGDSRVTDSSNTNLVDFCADGTGYFFAVTTQSLAQLAGESILWEVVPNIGGRWNEGKLRITPLDASIVLQTFTDLPYSENTLRAPTDESGNISTHKFIASLSQTPGILHPNEADSVFTIAESAETVCRA